MTLSYKLITDVNIDAGMGKYNGDVQLFTSVILVPHRLCGF